MANFVFNIAKGRVVELFNRVDLNDPTNAAIIVVPVDVAAVSDATIKDFDTLSAVTGGGVTERSTSGWNRKTLVDTDIATITPDDTGDTFSVTIADQTWTAVSAGAVTDLLVCYDSDTTGGTDANIVPLLQLDFAITPDGSDVVADAWDCDLHGVVMLGVPQFGDVKVVSNYGIVGTTALGTAVVSGAADTYGSVTELISAANNVQDSWGIEVTLTESGVSTTQRSCSLDILIGGATDDVLISSLLCGAVYAGASRTYWFPLHIPAGLRVAARTSNTTTTITTRVGCNLFGGCPPPFRVGNKVTTYGTKINNSRGLAVTPATSGGTATATQMTASTTSDHFYFYPGFQASTGTITLKTINIGIGVGASTEERIGTWWYQGDTGEKTTFWGQMGAWRSIAAGNRLTMLASNSGANDTFDGLIYAVS